MAYFSLDWAGDIFEDLYSTRNMDAFVYTKKTKTKTKPYLFTARTDYL